jgi:hypothetical protein
MEAYKYFLFSRKNEKSNSPKINKIAPVASPKSTNHNKNQLGAAKK